MIETNVTSAPKEHIEALKEELLVTFRNALGRSDFMANDGFLDFGGDSLTVIETIFDIEKRYGISLSTAEFMALDTAENLSRHIVTALPDHNLGDDARDYTVLSVVQEGERPHPLICIYGATGEAAYAITLAGLLPVGQPVAALHIHADEVLRRDVGSFREMAKSAASKILQQYGHGPCIVMGHSLGAHVALAVGHELAQRGSPPACIIVLDDAADLDRRHFGALQQSNDAANTWDTMRIALQCSPAEPIATRLVYFRSAENDAYYRSDPTSGWGEIATGGVTQFDVAVNHNDFVRERGLRKIVPRLVEEIARPRKDAPRPSTAQVLRFEARRAAREGDLTTELACMNRVIEQDNEQPSWLYANLAEALFQKGDTAAALSALSKAHQRENWKLSLDVRFIGEIDRLGFKEEHANVMHRLKAMISDHPSVFEQKAQVYFRLGHWEECEVELRAGLALHPRHFRLSRFFVRYLRQIKAWPELLETTVRLVESFPEISYFRTSLMIAHTKTGSPDQALQFRDTIVRGSQPDPLELIALARALIHCGEYAEALEIAEHAIRTAPWRPNAHLLRAKCLNLLGRKAEGAAARNQATELRAKLATHAIR